MKPIKIIIIAVLFVFMVLACLQILGIINSEAATENASKAMYVVLIVGGFVAATFFLVRSGSTVSKEDKQSKSSNSGPDFTWYS